MSGVYQRNREVSEYKFFTQAIAIRVEVNKLMASSSVVPKAYRLLNAVPTVETARSIVYNVNRADCFYPNSSFNALERKRYLTLAIADCEQLMLDMQCLMDIGLPVNANRFEALAGMVEEEIKLLKGARKNVRVTGKKTTDERIADALTTLQGLYKEGLLREDYLVSPVADSFNAGEAGIIYSVCWGPVNTIDLFNLDENVDLIAADIPTVTGEKPQYKLNAVPNQFIFVSKDATEQQKEAIIKMWDLQQALWSDMDSDIDWGYHRGANAINNADQYESSFQYALYYDEIEHAFTTGDLDSFKTANGKTYYNRVMNYLAGDKTLAKYYPIYRVPGGTYNVINTAMKEDRVHNSFYTAPETEFMQENRPMLDEMLVDAANQVIMGADISVWTDAVAEWYATGGQEMTDEVNEWYAANK